MSKPPGDEERLSDGLEPWPPPEVQLPAPPAGKPRPHRFTPEEASAAGRKGGRATKRPRGLATRKGRSEMTDATLTPGSPVWFAPPVLGYGYAYPGRGIPAVVLRHAPMRVWIEFTRADTSQVVRRPVSARNLSRRDP